MHGRSVAGEPLVVRSVILFARRIRFGPSTPPLRVRTPRLVTPSVWQACPTNPPPAPAARTLDRRSRSSPSAGYRETKSTSPPVAANISAAIDAQSGCEPDHDTAITLEKAMVEKELGRDAGAKFLTVVPISADSRTRLVEELVTNLFIRYISEFVFDTHGIPAPMTRPRSRRVSVGTSATISVAETLTHDRMPTMD